MIIFGINFPQIQTNHHDITSVTCVMNEWQGKVESTQKRAIGKSFKLLFVLVKDVGK